MLLFHVTSPAIAIEIISHGIFRPSHGHPHYMSNGINCFESKEKSENSGQPLNKGATLVLEWLGEPATFISKIHDDINYKKDILYDDDSWRYFIKAGTNPELIRVISVEFDDEAIKSVLNLPIDFALKSPETQDQLIMDLKASLYAFLEEKYVNKVLNLTIIEAPGYEQT